MFEFWATFAVLTALIVFCDVKYCMLRDQSAATPQPYSWSRVQLAWWSVIILTSFIAIFITNETHQVPALNQSVLILLGISGATIVTARAIDVSDTNNNLLRHQDAGSQNFFLDILSDSNGVSVHRFQAIVFNATFGCWFIVQVVNNIHVVNINAIMPAISNNNLVLLGISSATYAAMKTSENKITNPTVQVNTPAQPAATPPSPQTTTVSAA